MTRLLPLVAQDDKFSLQNEVNVAELMVVVGVFGCCIVGGAQERAIEKGAQKR